MNAPLRQSRPPELGEHDACAMSTVAAIARETGAAAEIVKVLYTEEILRLEARARIKQYIPLLAIRCVKQRLREMNRLQHP